MEVTLNNLFYQNIQDYFLSCKKCSFFEYSVSYFDRNIAVFLIYLPVK